MTPSLKISEKLLNRLSRARNEEHLLGKLYGILAKNTLLILGLELKIDEESDDDLTYSFPAEVDVCGIISIGDGSYDEQQIKKGLSHVDVTDNPVFINYTATSAQIEVSFFVNDQLEKAKYVPITEQEILSQFFYVRLLGCIPLTCEVKKESIVEGFQRLRKSAAAGIMTFRFENTSVFLLEGNSENGVIGMAGNQAAGELCGEFNDLIIEGSGKSKKKTQNFEVEVLNVNMLKRMTKDEGMVGYKKHAPVCVLDKKPTKTLSCVIPIDAITMLCRLTKIHTLYEIMVESVIKNLKLIEASFLASFEQPGFSISQPEVFHFYPDECGHFFTRIYQKDENENLLLSGREKLHKQFLLPNNRPMFRRANSYTFKNNRKGTEPLLNPHEGLRPTDNGGRISLVKGKYQYYHYGQNKMDDNGWGCAYRSLQTLASWFKLQGYTEKEVPTFLDIQKCLFDIGDKPKSFVGSKQWIGSTEVNFVLNSLLGMTCKILYVSSGEEMASKGPELLSHFEVHGSPVMIGGGVLAHTILGVDYNPQTGNLKFLILDPHYTGTEDLHTIQSKGWCGWKGVDFWNKTAYYNMCLPQVPVGV